MIKQPPRCRHQDIHALFQCLDLRRDAHAAKNHRRAQRQIFAVDAYTLLDLRRQLARRRHDQRTHGMRSRLGQCRHQTLQQRQRKTGGLAGAGLGARQHIATVKNYRDRLHLDRRGLRVAMISNSTRQIGHKAKIGKQLTQRNFSLQSACCGASRKNRFRLIKLGV